MQSVCVFCGSSDSVSPEYLTAARQMGRTLAQRKIRLVFGGGRTGLMGVVADGALEAGGEAVGVIIPSMNTAALAHTSLTRLELTPDMHARKARMHELSDGFLALPGGYGTFDELFETLAWSQIGVHQKPVGLLNAKNYYAPLLAAIDHAVEEGFIFHEHRAALCCDSDPARLLEAMENYRPSGDAVRRWMRQE